MKQTINSVDAFLGLCAFQACSLMSASGGMFSESLSDLAKVRPNAAADRQACVLGFFVTLFTYFPGEISARCCSNTQDQASELQWQMARYRLTKKLYCIEKIHLKS